MHVGIQVQRAHNPAAIGLERAAGVVDARAGDARDQQVRESTRQQASDRSILTVLAPATDDVKAVVDALKQAPDVGRIVLQVAIHRHHDAAPRLLEPSRHRGGLPIVAAEEHEPQVRIARSERSHQMARAIAAAVVHEDDLVGASKVAQGPRQRRVKRQQVVPLVVDGHHHAHVRRWSLEAPRILRRRRGLGISLGRMHRARS